MTNLQTFGSSPAAKILVEECTKDEKLLRHISRHLCIFNTTIRAIEDIKNPRIAINILQYTWDGMVKNIESKVFVSKLKTLVLNVMTVQYIKLHHKLQEKAKKDKS